MLWLLRRFIDPIAWRDEQAEVRRLREEPQVDLQPEGGGRVLLDGGPSRAIDAYTCRVCARRSIDGSYCPECVALTMVKAGS